MKKWLGIFAATFLVQVSPAFAFLVESGFVQQASGHYVKATKVTCDGNTGSLCFDLCKNTSQCQREEPYCRNCAGTSSPLLRQLFTQIARTYALNGEVTDIGTLIRFLADEKYVLLDLKSIFNYYTPVAGDSFAGDLRSFCGDAADSALLAVKLDQVHQPVELNYVLCRNEKNLTTAFEVHPRQPGFGERPLSIPLIFNLN